MVIACAEVKIAVTFKDSGRFNTRYSTLEFQDTASLGDGELRPVVRAARLEPRSRAESRRAGESRGLLKIVG